MEEHLTKNSYHVWFWMDRSDAKTAAVLRVEVKHVQYASEVGGRR